MAERIVLAEIDLNTEQLTKKNSELITAIANLKKEQKDLRTETNNLTEANSKQAKQYVENDIQLKKLNTQYNTSKKVLSETATTTNEFNRIMSLEVKTIAQAREQNKQLNRIRNNVNANTDAGRKKIEQLNNQLNKNNQFIKGNVSNLEQQKIGIGNYEDAILEASKKINIFGFSLNGVITRLKGTQQQFKGQLTQMKQNEAGNLGLAKSQGILGVATNGLVKGLKLFRLALASTGIGAIVVALGSLITFLSTTQEGMDYLNRAIAPLRAGLDLLLGIIQSAGKAVFDSFKNGGSIFKNLGESIRQNVVNRVNGLIEGFKAILSLMGNIATFNFDEAGQDLKDIGNNLLQVGTGVEDFAGKVQSAFESTADFIDEAVESGQRLVDLQVEIEESENRLKIIRSEQQKIIFENNRIAQDISKTTAEREQASIRASEASNKLILEEQKILDQKIERLKLEQSLNDTSREEQGELNDLIAKRNEVETQQIRLQTRLNNTLNTIRKQAEAERQKELDERIKASNEELAILEARSKLVGGDLDIETQIADKRQQILEQQLQAEKITTEQFEIEKQKILADSLKRSAEIQVQSLKENLALFRAENLRSQEGLNAELLNNEISQLQKIKEVQQQALMEQQQQGLISDAQYKLQKLALDDEFEKEKKTITQKRIADDRATEQERIALEFDEKLLRLEEENATEQEIKLLNLEREREQEQAILAQKLALQKITQQKFDAESLKLAQQTEQAKATVAIESEVAKLQARGQVLGAVAEAFGAETVLGKASAIAQTTINTFAGATRAFVTPGGIAGAVLAGSIIGTGLANVAKISGVGLPNAGGVSSTASSIGQIGNSLKGLIPKKEQGGLIPAGGKLHSQGGTKYFGEDGNVFEVERGELMGVMNRKASSIFMEFNNMFRNKKIPTSSPLKFATGGLVTAGGRQAQVFDYDLLASKISEANQSLPTPQVVVTDIIDGISTQTQIVNDNDI